MFIVVSGVGSMCIVVNETGSVNGFGAIHQKHIICQISNAICYMHNICLLFIANVIFVFIGESTFESRAADFESYMPFSELCI